ncbi:hypothetical protein EC844_1242 [Acinetobacter calcoaceticus]|uniref:Uncharacterized protein n=1 Tax=Acinetobacter calcoaceticus TaxID=471 RepID=A0A4R1XLN2_ACICA|nr:hypothetical protein EC844_1242 [Acinetobacter calcoaceticus]
MNNLKLKLITLLLLSLTQPANAQDKNVIKDKYIELFLTIEDANYFRDEFNKQHSQKKQTSKRQLDEVRLTCNIFESKANTYQYYFKHHEDFIKFMKNTAKVDSTKYELNAVAKKYQDFNITYQNFINDLKNTPYTCETNYKAQLN